MCLAPRYCQVPISAELTFNLTRQVGIRLVWNSPVNPLRSRPIPSTSWRPGVLALRPFSTWIHDLCWRFCWPFRLSKLPDRCRIAKWSLNDDWSLAAVLAAFFLRTSETLVNERGFLDYNKVISLPKTKSLLKKKLQILCERSLKLEQDNFLKELYNKQILVI